MTSTGPRKLLLATLAVIALFAGGHGHAGPVEVTARFGFFSDPWLNLHHFLYQWARAEEGIGEDRTRVEVPERADTRALTAAELDAWQAALAAYRAQVARLDHLGDPMLGQKRALLRAGGDPETLPDAVIDGVDRALAAAMPVYLAHWWPAHDAANRRWIAATVPLLREHEEALVEMTRSVYDAAWPEPLRRIDVSAYANFRGGYTALGHTVIYSTDPGSQDLYGLEILLHESQHTREVTGAFRRALRARFADAGVEIPPNLAHAVMFATSGEFVRALAAREGWPPYLPYWEREGFAAFSGWSQAADLVAAHWLPALAGELSAEAAIARMLEAQAARQAPQLP